MNPPDPAGFAATFSNGHSPSDAVQADYEANLTAKREYQLETRRMRDEISAEVNRLCTERLALQKQASLHAGNIGHLYVAATNSFTRTVIVDPPYVIGTRPSFDIHSDEATAAADHQDGNILENAGTTRGNEPADTTNVESEMASDPGSIGESRFVTVEPISVPPPIAKPELPAVEPRPLPVQADAVPRPEVVDKSWHLKANLMSGFSWILAAIVGAFVGFGILTIAGLPYARPEDFWFLIGGIAVGIAAICGIKLLMHVMWFEAGKRREVDRLSSTASPGLSKGSQRENLGFIALCLAVSVGLILVEGWLGGQAIVAYSAKTSRSGVSSVGLMTGIMVAMAISTATMLFSGFLGHQKGQRAVTHEEVRHRHYQLAMQDFESRQALRQAEYKADLALWQVEEDRREQIRLKHHEQKLKAFDDRVAAHDDHVAQWKAHNELVTKLHSDGVAERQSRTAEVNTFANDSDYQAMCTYIGQIGAVTAEIDRLRQKDTNISISRGYGKKYLS